MHWPPRWHFSRNRPRSCIILIIGYIIAKLLQKVIAKVSQRVGFDRSVERGGAKTALAKIQYGASDILAEIVFYTVMLFVLSTAFGAFGPTPISDYLRVVIAYLPLVFVAILIVVITSAIAAGAKALIQTNLDGLSYGKPLANLVSGLILALGVIAALDQLHIAENVVNAVLYAALAAIVGIASVAIGGGIKPMTSRWENTLARYDEEKPRVTEQARTAPSLEEQVQQTAPPPAEQHPPRSPDGRSAAGAHPPLSNALHSLRPRPQPRAGAHEHAQPRRNRPAAGKDTMSIANMSDPNTITGAPVHSNDGEKLGKVHSIYYDNDTNRPEWAAVKSGLFGGHVTLVPLNQSRWDGTTLTVPFDKESLQNAPHHDPDREISRTDEEELYRHYGLSTDRPGAPPPAGQQDDRRAGDQRRDRTGESGIQGRDTSGPTTDEAMTRSEEQLHVGTEQTQAGRARLRKHIVTEHVTTTVPVRHEEVTLEREPITEANRGEAMAGGDLTEEEHEVTLHAERPVVEKEAVPVERVRLGTETVTEQHQVDETVRKEQIEAEGTEGVDVGDQAGGKHTAHGDRR